MYFLCWIIFIQITISIKILFLILHLVRHKPMTQCPTTFEFFSVFQRLLIPLVPSSIVASFSTEKLVTVSFYFESYSLASFHIWVLLDQLLRRIYSPCSFPLAIHFGIYNTKLKCWKPVSPFLISLFILHSLWNTIFRNL